MRARAIGDLSQHFNRVDFACGCGCGRNTVDYQTLIHLEYERVYFGRPIYITSGYRCAEHNRLEGGKPNSEHLFGRAVDSWCDGVTPVERYAYYNTRWPGRYGLGVYVAKNFLHFDTRSGRRARWSGKGDVVKL